MRCPYCRNSDAKVVDSRDAEAGLVIRRRRECLDCSRRFTTYERVEALPLRVLKRSGVIEPYQRGKVEDGIRKACKNRPVTEEQIQLLTDDVEAIVWKSGVSQVDSREIGVATLERLRIVDPVAYLRFASVYKDFQEVSDFEHELGLLLRKKTPPKVPASSKS
jgi:transcriptional repressor NrdR